MNDRLAALTARRTALQAKCAAERNSIAQTYALIEHSAGRVDRVIDTVRRLTPLIALGGIVAIVVAGPSRAIGMLRKGLTLALYTSQASRLLR